MQKYLLVQAIHDGDINKFVIMQEILPNLYAYTDNVVLEISIIVCDIDD